MAIFKTIELVATSKKDWADAVKQGFARAKKTLNNIRNIYIKEQDVKVKEDSNELIYRVRCDITFELSDKDIKEYEESDLSK